MTTQASNKFTAHSIAICEYMNLAQSYDKLKEREWVPLWLTGVGCCHVRLFKYSTCENSSGSKGTPSTANIIADLDS